MRFVLEQEINEELDNIPKYLYHATYRQFLNSIKKRGLGNTARKMWSDSKGRGVVYLAVEPEIAYSYAEEAEWLDEVDDPDRYIDNIIVLKIDASKLDKSKLYVDENVMDSDSTFEYHGIIPYEYVSDIVDEDGSHLSI